MVFPAESYAEKEGTVVHPDGRLQRLRPAISRPGHTRPEWQVLADLAARLDLDLGVLTGPMASAQLFEAVPFYAGLTLEEIGGRGVRWQERDAAAGLPAGDEAPFALGDPSSAPPADANGSGALLLGTFRSLWSSPEVEVSPALQFLRSRQCLEISPVDADRLGIGDGEQVEVVPHANGSGGAGAGAGAARRAGRIQAAPACGPSVALREALAPGTVFLQEATAEGLRDVADRRRPRAAGGGPPGVIATVGYYEPWWIQILKAIVIFAVGLQLVPVVLLVERKLLGRFQGRYGPNRVGPYGVAQPLADILKLLTKEQSRPDTSVGALFVLAPIVSICTAVAAFAIIPFGDPQDIFGTKVGLYGVDVWIGPLYLFAFGAIAFYGLMLGGWASGSKYSFLGAMRAAAQLISYEVSQGLALLGVVISAQTLSLTGIVHAQAGMWYIVPQFVGFLIFMTASFAETNRAPFDLAEADAELVGGYNTEYGGGASPPTTSPSTSTCWSSRGSPRPSSSAAGCCPSAARRGLGGSPRGPLQDGHLHLLLHLDQRHAAAAALRPADVARLEGAAPAGHAERPGDRDRGDGMTSSHYSTSTPGNLQPQGSR